MTTKNLAVASATHRVRVLSIGTVVILWASASPVSLVGQEACKTFEVGIARSAQPAGEWRLVAFPEHYWPNGTTLGVFFFNGTPAMQQRVLDIAQKWSEFANITFVRSNNQTAPIRIRFDSNSGHWSKIGRYCIQTPAGEPTMNLGFDTAPPDAELRRVVLHEFGHAIGLTHEQFHQDAKIPWDETAVYRYFSGPPNYWNAEQIRYNVLQPQGTPVAVYDRASIMHYAVPNSLTKGDYEIGWNNDLSDLDKSGISNIYPKPRRGIGNGFDNFKFLVASNGGRIYGVKPDGTLLRYRDVGGIGERRYAETQVQVGTGFGNFKGLFGGADGRIYGIKPDGELLRYRDGGSANERKWAEQQVVIGNGWGNFSWVFAGDEGRIYAIKPNGDLLRYRDVGALGERKWAEQQVLIGTGWDTFTWVFTTDGGRIYGVKPNGELLRYRDVGGLNERKWAEQQVLVGTGFGNFIWLIGSDQGRIYGVTPNGDLLRYRDAGRVNERKWAEQG